MIDLFYSIAWNLNPFFWVLSNILVAYIAIMLVIFVGSYLVLFDPRATTAGRLILSFATSLIFVIGLIVISVFIDPRQGGAWYEYPGDINWWRPFIRLVAYSYVAYTITGLAFIVWFRKFFPHRLKTAPEKYLHLKVRHPHEKETS